MHLLTESDPQISPGITHFRNRRRIEEETWGLEGGGGGGYPTMKRIPESSSASPRSQPTFLLEAEYNLSRLRFKVPIGMRYNYFAGESKEHGSKKERDRERGVKRDGRVLFGDVTH